MSQDKKPLVYIKHPEFAWIPAKLDKIEGDKAYVSVPQYKDEQSIISDGGRSAKTSKDEVVNLKDYPHKVLPLQNVDNNNNLLECSDMVQLPYLHEAGILYNLKERHRLGKPYTRTGDIIIATNPFQWFTHLYTEKVRVFYSNKLVWHESEKDPREGLEPHVYEVSALSYKGLAFGGSDQSILVSGESGAGKTETVKICMNHMASVQAGPSDGNDTLDPVVQRVVDSNPLLEAFGNAKTRRNDNSSRFGKYLCLQFDNSEASLMAYGAKTESKCKLAGSKCEVYLLEKPRVVNHDPEERTYHIFYQILAAPDEDKTKFWKGLKGKTSANFKYVGTSTTTTIEGQTDAQHFANTIKTLALINVVGDKLHDLMTAIITVIQCGNLTFGAKGGDKDKSEITSKDDVKGLAELMGVEEEVLGLTFTERTMKTRTETYKVPLNPTAAKDASDALAKEVYGNVFLWLVKQINAATCAEDNYKDGSMENFGLIGLLDIFGFESFPINRFEQLCINYANEKLQQKFTEDIFRSVQDEYESEGIELAEIWYDDNTDVLDLIEGRGGLLAMLNEECVRPGGNDMEFVQKALTANAKSPCLITNKLNRMSFGIHHYAGKVMYDADFFVTSNQDTLPTDLADLFLKSSNTIIANNQAAEVVEEAGGRGAPKRQKSNLVAPTAWSKYKTQLTSLMTSLRKTNSRYIRCIKPNMAKKPILMDHLPSVEQLRCAGVVAAVTLSRSAFPNRLDNTVVRYRYTSMWDQEAFPSKKTDDMTQEQALRADCDAIMSSALKCKEEIDGSKVIKAFVCGRTRTYFRAGALEYLEANRLENGLDAPATKIQSLARGYMVRKNWDEMKSGAKEKERKKQEEAERLAKEAREKAEKDKQRKLMEESKKAKEAEARKLKEAEEERKRQEELAKKKREQEEKEALQREEEEAGLQLKKLQKKIKKLKKQLDDVNQESDKKVKSAEDEVRQIEEERDELQKKFDLMLQQAGEIPSDEIEANKKKVEEGDKIIAFLKKENKRVREKTDQMNEDMKEMKEQNARLIEANASAGASLDSMEKQKKNIASHNVKLEENLKKWKAQNNQLKADLANRTAYFKAETKIRAHYEKAMEQIIEILENKCDDADLVEEVTAAQLQCEALAAHKGSPSMESSDVSD